MHIILFIVISDLYRNDLSGAIPDGIGNLVNLSHLYLDNDYYYNVINMYHFRKFASNMLSGCIPESIGNLLNLESMYDKFIYKH